MDIYTASFTFPRPSTFLPPSGQRDPADGLPSNLTLPSGQSLSDATWDESGPSTPETEKADPNDDSESIQRLVLDITTREGCLVTATPEPPSVLLGDQVPDSASLTTPGEHPGKRSLGKDRWNFHLSGTYQSVMAARGAILREFPRDLRSFLQVPRTDILDQPSGAKVVVKSEVRDALEGIVLETQAVIEVRETARSEQVGGEVLAVFGRAAEAADGRRNGHGMTNVQDSGRIGSSEESDGLNSASSSSTNTRGGGTATGEVLCGLEPERMCDIVISGGQENIELAKVRVMVLLDQLSGLHVEFCDIDYKLHSIIGGRRRTVIQSIQEETGTNIYIPVPLVGIYDRPQPKSVLQHSHSYSSTLTPNLSYGSFNTPSAMSTQNTGMTQMTGFSGAPSGSAWNFGLQTPGPIGNGHGHGHGHTGFSRAPVYHHHHQHQHVQYPYHPSSMPYDSHSRGVPMAFGGGYPNFGHGQGHMNGMGNPVPMHMQNTGMSNMTSYAYPQRGGGHSSGYMHPGGGGGGMHNNYNHSNHGNLYQHHNHIHTQHQQHQHQHSHHRSHGYNQHGNQHDSHHHHMNGNNHNSYQYNQPPPPPPQYFANHSHHMGSLYGNGQTNHMQMGLGGQIGMHTGTTMGMNGHGGMGLPMHGGAAPAGQYGQGPHPGLAVHGGEQGQLGKVNQVWITGEFFGVQRARDMLLGIALQKSKLVISRDTAILPRKLDWLLTEKLDKVRTIMSDNGTYMQVPSVGSMASMITVFGDHPTNIERTIRSIMTLASKFYVASVWLLPVSFDVVAPQRSLNPGDMQPIIKAIAHNTGVEVVFKSNCFEMHGMESAVRTAVSMVLDLEIIHDFHHEIRFQIELANEHREFISGKKNGKLNKIMKHTGVKIKFETFNDYNFLIDISGAGIDMLAGLDALQKELPAEVSFHVPENYHKRMIGLAGKNIQRIMKQFGVYVKFANAEEYALIGGYTENEDNVIARTPVKNMAGLENFKAGVMELVNKKFYMTRTISIPRRYHRTLVSEKSIFIRDIEQKTNSVIRFPFKESAGDAVSIFGPGPQVPIAAAMLLDHVPFECDLDVRSSPEMTALVGSADFIAFIEQVKRDHPIAITPSARFGQGDEAIFKFRCRRAGIDRLSAAQEALEGYLSKHDVQAYPDGAEKRPLVAVDDFPHHSTGLSAFVPPLAQKLTPLDAEVDEAPETSLVKSRGISSDVKAIFDAPTNNGILAPKDDLNLPAGGSRGLGHLSLYDPSQLWSNSPQPTRSELIGNPLPTPSEVSSKRESDPLLPEKVRQSTISSGVPLSGSTHHALPRTSSARTQSLDITSRSFSRTLSSGAGGFGPLPASPVGLLGNSPNTASAQYFPSGSQGPVLGGGAGSSHGGKSFLFDSALEGVTSGEPMFSKLQHTKELIG